MMFFLVLGLWSSFWKPETLTVSYSFPNQSSNRESWESRRHLARVAFLGSLTWSESSCWR
jgi:hypothetical protein